MKNILIAFCIMLVFFTQHMSAQPIDARKAFERGMEAYNKERYIAAFPDLIMAALEGITGAYEPLFQSYAYGYYDGSGKGNYKDACALLNIGWENYIKGGEKDMELATTLVKYELPLNFYIGNYEKVIHIVTKGYWKGKNIPLEYMNQIALSYLKMGNTSKALEWLSKAIAEGKERGDEISTIVLRMTNSILAKIALDNKDYDKSLELSQEAAQAGNPLAFYTFGKSIIKATNLTHTGKDWIELAAEFDCSGFVYINCFDEEIKQYWNSIKNISE